MRGETEAAAAVVCSKRRENGGRNEGEKAVSRASAKQHYGSAFGSLFLRKATLLCSWVKSSWERERERE